MKKEELLEAVGYVNEDMLLDADRENRSVVKPVRRILLAAAVIGIVGITVAASTGLFSRPIGEFELNTEETVFPFDMDDQGNIILGGVKGITIRMEVTPDTDAPDYLEEFYRLNLSEKWHLSGGSGGGGLYTHFAWEDYWAQEGKPGELRLKQSVMEKGKTVQTVDLLHDLPADTKLTGEKTVMAGLDVLKVTIPALPGYQGTRYCSDGETRLYWSDGRYLLEFDYPAWLSDRVAESILKTLETEDFIVAFPEDYGKVNTQRLADLSPAFFVEKGKTGTAMANSVMGWGRFAYSDGVVYYGNDGKIIGYDLQTQEVKTYPLVFGHSNTLELFATENYICYEDMGDALMAVPKKGGEAIPIYQGLGVTHLYADGNVLYTNNLAEYLSRIDLESGKVERLVDNVNSYYVDDNYIYVVQSGTDANYFLRSRKDEIDFEKIELSFHPVKVLADGKDLYFCRGGKNYDWHVIRYRDGVETPLPLYAYDYQIMDGKLIYHDEKEKWTIKSYDLQTGEIAVLQERAHDFSIMPEGYIGFTCVDGNNHGYPLILNTKTGETYKPNY